MEFGSPNKLIEMNGCFARVVDDTGADMAAKVQRKALTQANKQN